jgi:hypothetical protein
MDYRQILRTAGYFWTPQKIYPNSNKVSTYGAKAPLHPDCQILIIQSKDTQESIILKIKDKRTASV